MARVADPYLLINTYDEDLILLALRTANKDITNKRRSPLDSSSPEPLISASDNLPSSKYFSLTRLKVAQVCYPPR